MRGRVESFEQDRDAWHRVLPAHWRPPKRRERKPEARHRPMGWVGGVTTVERAPTMLPKPRNIRAEPATTDDPNT